MRPQDIVILLKIVAVGEKDWWMKDMGGDLYIINGEVSESLNRSKFAGLIGSEKRCLKLPFYNSPFMAFVTLRRVKFIKPKLLLIYIEATSWYILI